MMKFQSRSAASFRVAAVWAATVLAIPMSSMALRAQAPVAPHQTGSVKSTGDHSLILTTSAGPDYTVTVPDTASVVQVAPGSTDLKSATPIKLADVSAGDKAIVTGTTGDTGSTLTARRIIIMKSTAITAENATITEAWKHGIGGLVKTVNPATGSLQIANGVSMLTVQTTAATKVRRYTGDSVRFEDAVAGKLADIHPGDELRARGTRTPDGNTLRADEIVSGAFQNLSGLLTAVDGTAGTVSLQDLATKKMVVVKVTDKSDLRRLPPQAAARFAARASGQGVSSEGTTPGSTGAAASGPGGSQQAGSDLSQMLSRLPTEVLGGLKVGDAVMIVASGSGASPAAVTLLVGVDPILRAAPQGEMTLAPWSVGSGGTSDAE